MKPTQALHEAGQSLWLDNITRALLDEGILARYVAEYSVTGLTSNPTIFDRAIRDGTAYDADIAARKADGATDELEALAAPFTVNTMPDQTLEAFADHGTVGEFLPADGGDADQVIAAFAQAGIDTAALAAELQRQGAEAFAALLAGPAGPDRRPARAARPDLVTGTMEHAVHGSHRFQGVIFDVDGVLVDSPHYRARRDALQELMGTEWTDVRGRTSYAPEKFTEAVYQQVVAGRPRLAGARAALEYFGVPDAGRRAEPFAAVKQEHLVTLIEAGEFTAFADAIRFVLATKAAGISVAAASSSKNHRNRNLSSRSGAGWGIWA